MKILRITSLGCESGGAENGIVLLKPALEALGHTVKVFASDAMPEKERFSDYEFPALGHQPFFLKVFYKLFYPHAFFALRRVLKEFQPDVVQLHTMYEVSPSVLFLLKKYPTIMTVHGAEEYTKHLLTWSYPKRFFKKNSEDFEKKDLNVIGRLHLLYNTYIIRPWYRLLFRYIDVFLVMSTYMQEKLREEKIESVCIPNATQLFTSKVIRATEHHVVYVGRLEKIKGVHYLLQAIPHVLAEYPNTLLTIVGTGAYEYELRELATKLHLDESVRFVGNKSRNEVEKFFEQATVVVVPSVWPEPFGKVGIEAMSVGRPVIATDVGGVREWLSDGYTGFLVPPKDSEALSKKILTLFGDQKLLVGMAEQASLSAQRFSIEEYALRVSNLYGELYTRYHGGEA